MRVAPSATALVTIFLLLASLQPAEAQRRARLSQDLADHLAAGSQTIDVIVHGDAQTIATIAAKYNLRVKKSMRSGAVIRMNASQLEVVQKDDAVDHLSGDVRIQVGRRRHRDHDWRRPALGRCRRSEAADRQGRRRRGDRFRDRHEAQRVRQARHQDRGLHGRRRLGQVRPRHARRVDHRGASVGGAGHRGIAYGAYLINLRALGDDGSGTVSAVIEAIDWAIDNQKQYNIGVINLSLGAPVLQPFRDDPLCEAVERATRAGILVVAAAGNHGQTEDGIPQFGLITSPGNSPFALTVGAIDTHETAQRSNDTLAPFSSKGPTRFDMVLKPDVVAPGVRILGAEATGSYLSQTYPARHVSGERGGRVHAALGHEHVERGRQRRRCAAAGWTIKSATARNQDSSAVDKFFVIEPWNVRRWIW